MEREILFKAKRVDNGEWINGDLVTNAFLRREEGQENNQIPYILDVSKADYDCFEDLAEENGYFEVTTETICQYTGLCDKNGRRIWEGDIVQRDIFGETVIGEIAWDDMVGAGFYLKVKHKNGIGFYPMGKGQFDDDDGEMCNDIILGNIFDNPELLKR